MWYVFIDYMMLTDQMLPDFFRDGVTELDECYFNAQQDRQHLESTLVIPQLKYSSRTQRPYKRPRSG